MANEDSENEDGTKSVRNKNNKNNAAANAEGEGDIEQQVGKIVSKQVESKGELLNEKMSIWRQEVDDLVLQRFNEINNCLLQ